MSTSDTTNRSMKTKNIASHKNKVEMPMLLLEVTRQRDTSEMEEEIKRNRGWTLENGQILLNITKG